MAWVEKQINDEELFPPAHGESNFLTTDQHSMLCFSTALLMCVYVCVHMYVHVGMVDSFIVEQKRRIVERKQ